MWSPQTHVLVAAVGSQDMLPSDGPMVAHACRLVALAARQDASLVAFLAPFTPRQLDAAASQQLCRAARSARIHVALGVSGGQPTLNLIDSMGRYAARQRAAQPAAAPLRCDTPFGTLGLVYAAAASAARVQAATMTLCVVFGQAPPSYRCTIARQPKITVIAQDGAGRAAIAPAPPPQAISARVWDGQGDRLLLAEIAIVGRGAR